MLMMQKTDSRNEDDGSVSGTSEQVNLWSQQGHHFHFPFSDSSSFHTLLFITMAHQGASNVSDVDSILIGFIDRLDSCERNITERIVEARFAFLASVLSRFWVSWTLLSNNSPVQSIVSRCIVVSMMMIPVIETTIKQFLNARLPSTFGSSFSVFFQLLGISLTAGFERL